MNSEQIKLCVSKSVENSWWYSCSNYLYPIKQAWRLSSGQAQEGFAPGVLRVSQAMFNHSLLRAQIGTGWRQDLPWGRMLIPT